MRSSNRARRVDFDVEDSGPDHRKTRVYLIDDRTAAAGLRSVLDGEPDLEVVGVARHWWQALRAVRTEVDVSVIDLSPPGFDAGLAIRRFRQVNPYLTIIALVEERDRHRADLLDSGAISGHLLKRRAGADLAPAIRRARRAAAPAGAEAPA